MFLTAVVFYVGVYFSQVIAKAPLGHILSYDEATLPSLAMRHLLDDLSSLHVEEIIHRQPKVPVKANQDIVNFVRKLLYPKIPTAFSDKVGQTCKEDSIDYLRSVLSYTDWALKMYDASSVENPGVLSMALHAEGHFDQCLATKAPRFRGKYCTSFYNFFQTSLNTTGQENLNHSNQRLLSIFQLLGLFGIPVEDSTFLPKEYSFYYTYIPSVGLCLPSTCNTTEIRDAFADLIGSYGFLGNGTFSYVATYTGDEYCYVTSEGSTEYSDGDIAMMTILSFIGVLVLASTIYETVASYNLGEPILASKTAKDKKYVQYLCVFSLVNNSKKLMSTRTNEGSLGCIHGIRVLSITWVIMGHAWLMVNNGNNMNTGHVMTTASNWISQTLLNATVSVDSFFLLSGLLASYVLLIQLDKAKGRINPLMVYVHRYLRLTPVYALILGFNATLVVHLSSGPYWYGVEYMSNACRKVWWQQLLYVNNLVTRSLDENMCMGETWYIAVDMQLFLITPILVYLIWRWKKVGLVGLALTTAGFLVGNIVFYATHDVLPTSIATRKDGDLIALLEVYLKPWYRAPAYLVGVFVGWALYVTKRKFKAPKMLILLGWCCAIAIACSVLYGLTAYTSQTVAIPEAVKITYGPFERFAWAIAVSWVVFACVNGYGGYVNQFLSWKAFVPLGRLSYCVYLIHLNLLIVYSGQQRTMFYHTDLNAFYVYLATTTMSFGLAFIAAVTIETPFLMLEKLLFGEKSSRKPTEEKTDHAELARSESDVQDARQHNEAYDKKE